MIGGEYGALWRNDGAKTHLLLTNQGDVYGGWNTLRPFSIDNATGELVIGTKLSASLNGNALTATKLQKQQQSCKRQDGFLVLSLMVPKILL